jgi:anti-anti-sigma regulatory factor
MSNDKSVFSSLFTIRFDKDIAIFSPLDKSFINSQAGEFNRVFDELRQQDFTKFILDFSNCDHISSEGLNITAQCWKVCHDQGYNLMVVVPEGPKNEVREMFDLIGLSRMIGGSLKPTMLDAILALRENPPK